MGAEIELTEEMIEAGARYMADSFALLKSAARGHAEAIFKEMLSHAPCPSARE